MTIRLIAADDDTGGFTCGEPARDRYLAKFAWQNDQADIARCRVSVDDTVSPARVRAYYTIATRTVEPHLVAHTLPGRPPRYPLSVFYIGMFAVSRTEQRHGEGKRLMADALRQCASASQQIGAVGVLLDSLNDKSTAFYTALGFEVLGAVASPQPMFLRISELRQAIT